MRNQSTISETIFHPRISENGSLENRTIHEAEMFAAIRNRLYLCSAFETQVRKIEY